MDDLEMNDLDLIDEIVKRAEEHQKLREKNFAIAEIKNIRAKLIEEYKNDQHMDNYTTGVIHKIIDNQIEKLEGDKNNE